MNNDGSPAICKSKKLKLGQQNNDKGSINLAGANKKASLKCKKIIIKTLAKLYESVYCHSNLEDYIQFAGTYYPFITILRMLVITGSEVITGSDLIFH